MLIMVKLMGKLPLGLHCKTTGYSQEICERDVNGTKLLIVEQGLNGCGKYSTILLWNLVETL